MEIKTQIDILSEICHYDQDLICGRNKISRLSSDSEIAKKNVDELEALLKGLIKEKEKTLVEYRGLDSKLQEEKSNLRKWEQRADQIKAEREFNALNSEISAQKRTILGLDTQLLSLSEKIKEIEKKITKAEGDKKDNSSKSVKAFEEVKELLEEEQEKVKSIEDAKKKLLDKLPPAIKARYQKVYDRMGNIGVAFCENEICHGCMRTIPPNLFIEIQQYKLIESCPSCHRFLVPPSS